MRVLRFLLLIALLTAGVVAFYVYVSFGPSRETFVDIAPGTSTAGIAAQLQRAGIIRSHFAFEAMKEVRGGALKAGEYRFDHAAPLGEVYDRLRKGDVYTVALLIPEGSNIFDIAKLVQDAGLDNAANFLTAERGHTELIRQWSPQAASLEGYLFPDTYRFSRHTTSLQMLSAMVRRFRLETTQLGLVTDTQRSVILASLVEKEVKLDAERPVVAGVFENRLAAQMPLQTDPTVIYASLLRGTWMGVIHQSELHSNSAYNTYAHAGLPPGPICNPGAASLRAALHPAKTQYLYFVADANGATRFSTDLKSHSAQVEQFRAASSSATPPTSAGTRH